MGGVSLQECLDLALKNSEAVLLGANQIRQSDSLIKQAEAGFRPTLALQSSLSQQAESTNPLANNLSSTRQSATSLNLNQNLFHGFKDSATVRQKQNLKISDEWAKKQAIQQLFLSVAQSYYSLLIFQSDIKMYQEQIQSLMSRKSELKSARKSGRARDTDVMIAESSIASLEATISRTQGLVIDFQETFKSLTGLSSTTKLIDNVRLPKDFKTREQWIQKSTQRPEIQQSRSQIEASVEGIEVAKSGYYPTVGLSANYYLNRPRGIFQGVNWDASLTLSFPIFSGGLTKAQVSEAVMFKQSQELKLQQAEELATQSIRVTFETLKTDQDQLQKLSRASELSRESYNLLRRDNRLGVATNMEVLTALQIWQESTRNQERARITVVYDYVKLLIETSEMKDVESSDKDE